jgi:phospholipid-binding lipoprotein MlaA
LARSEVGISQRTKNSRQLRERSHQPPPNRVALRRCARARAAGRLRPARRFFVALSVAFWVVVLLAPLRLGAQPPPGLFLASGEARQETGQQEMSLAYSDPLAPINEKFFAFNMQLDRWVTRPIATGWSHVAPQPVRQAVGRFFDNVNVIPRFANNLFQLKFAYAGEEAARFLINTTVGIAGFFDPAETWFGLKEHPQDFGLTLGYYGVGMGPYLMVPIFGPFDLRDGFGYVVDGFMNPIDYIVTIVQVVYIYTGVIAARSVNYESLHLDLFEDADRYSVDLYGAVQDAYLQHRERLLREALNQSRPQPHEHLQDAPGAAKDAGAHQP